MAYLTALPAWIYLFGMQAVAPAEVPADTKKQG
jgi:hypothetical protein